MLEKRIQGKLFFASWALLASLNASGAISVEGVEDKKVYTDEASFKVLSEAGYTITASLNGEPVPLDSVVTVDYPEYYELVVRAEKNGGGAEESERIRFIVKDSERKNSEWGLPPWVPYAPVDSAESEFTGSHLTIITPRRYPQGLDIPVVAFVEDENGKRVGVVGTVSSPELPDLSIKILRGVGSGFLPAPAEPGPVAYTARIKSIEKEVQIDIETSTSWRTVSGKISSTTDWGEGARIHVTDDLSVESGATLTIGPGSVIKLAPGVEILVTGRLTAEGTRDRPIVFTPERRDDPWGGIVVKSSASRLNLTGVIVTGSGADPDWFGNNPGSGHSHRHEECAFHLSDGARAVFTDTYFIYNEGQGGHGEDAFLTMTRCLIQKCITAGQYNGGSVRLTECALIEFPSYDAPFADDDNDAIYFTDGDHHLVNTLIGWALDDAVDAGSGSGGTVEVTGCWIESCFHEGMAWSGGDEADPRVPTVRDTVAINCGQGIECGWNRPLVNAKNIFVTANAVGARFGDNYDWHYNGTLTVTGSLLLYNKRNIWGMNWEDWEERLSQMDIHDNFLSEPDPLHPDNELWDGEADAAKLIPFLPVPEGKVGVGWAVPSSKSAGEVLPEGLPVRLSTFTTKTVTVEYSVESEKGPLASGTLTFLPGETVKKVFIDEEELAGNSYFLFTLSDPTNAELTGEETLSVVRPVELIAKGSVWKYLDDGTDQGTAWREPEFSDEAWKSGPAELGYGDGDEATVIESGPSGARRPTAYFRRSFIIEGTARFERVTLRIKRDDGAIVYINGVEVFRTNMPTGTVTYSTWASGATSDENAFRTHQIDPAVLHAGENVVAVEVHQANATSSDLSFDLELAALPLPPSPRGFVRGDANGDSKVDISDAVQILQVLFAGAESNCDDALDANDSGDVNIADAIFVLSYLFANGAPIPEPFPEPGVDPTEDALGCKRAE